MKKKTTSPITLPRVNAYKTPIEVRVGKFARARLEAFGLSPEKAEELATEIGEEAERIAGETIEKLEKLFRDAEELLYDFGAEPAAVATPAAPKPGRRPGDVQATRPAAAPKASSSAPKTPTGKSATRVIIDDPRPFGDFEVDQRTPDLDFNTAPSSGELGGDA